MSRMLFSMKKGKYIARTWPRNFCLKTSYFYSCFAPIYDPNLKLSEYSGVKIDFLGSQSTPFMLPSLEYSLAISNKEKII